MKLFISHARYDSLVARVMRDVLGRAGLAETFFDIDDIRTGDDWMANIQTAVADCDAILTLITPEFSGRPWMAAEWAAFWIMRKKTYILTYDVRPENLFEPLRRVQAGDLKSASSITAFLDDVASTNVDNFRLAAGLVERVEQARSEQLALHADELYEHIASSRDGVDDETIDRLINAGMMDRLLRLPQEIGKKGRNVTRLRLYQVVHRLLIAGTPPDVLVDLARAINNSNYQRDIVIQVLQSSVSLDEKQRFADALSPVLANVARRKVVAAAGDLGVPLSAAWDGIRPYEF